MLDLGFGLNNIISVLLVFNYILLHHYTWLLCWGYWCKWGTIKDPWQIPDGFCNWYMHMKRNYLLLHTVVIPLQGIELTNHDIIGVHSPSPKILGPPLIYLVQLLAILDPHINICVGPLTLALFWSNLIYYPLTHLFEAISFITL